MENFRERMQLRRSLIELEDQNVQNSIEVGRVFTLHCLLMAVRRDRTTFVARPQHVQATKRFVLIRPSLSSS